MSPVIVPVSRRIGSGGIVAGHQALAAGAWEEALALFRDALTDREDPRILEGLADAAWWVDDPASAFPARERAYFLYRKSNNACSAARTAMHLATDHFDLRAESAVSSGWFQRAARMLEGICGAPEHGWLAAWEAHVAILDSRPDAARHRIGVALEVGRSLGVVELETLALAQEARVLVAEGDIATGMRRLDEATLAVTSGEIRDHRVISTSYCYLIEICCQIGDFDRVAQWNNAVNRDADRWTCPAAFSRCQIDFVPVLLWRGRWSEAESQLSTILNSRPSVPAHAARAAVLLAQLRRRQARRSEATTLLDSAKSGAGRKLVEAPTLVARAELALDDLEAATAASLAKRLLRKVETGRHWERVRALGVLVRAQLLLGEQEAAHASVAQLRHLSTAVGTDAVRACSLLAEAVVAAADGEAEGALQCIEDAVEVFENSGAIYETARARIELAEMLRAAGHPQAAAREATSALDVFTQLGAADLERAGTLLRGLERDCTTGHPRHRRNSTLTARELQVLHLMAEGRSNHGIAEELYLSVRTVERHVSNIYRSLGVSGKAARAVAANTAGSRAGLLRSPTSARPR
jgi:DNA-binding NarL/FixJ family response regulator